MGFQKMMGNDGIDENNRAQASSQQRTSTTSKKSHDTSKCQYERLSTTKTIKGTTGE